MSNVHSVFYFSLFCQPYRHELQERARSALMATPMVSVVLSGRGATALLRPNCETRSRIQQASTDGEVVFNLGRRGWQPARRPTHEASRSLMRVAQNVTEFRVDKGCCG